MNLEFGRFGSRQAQAARVVVESVYRGAYVEFIESGDPFNQPEAFMRRWDSYARNPDIELVVAYADGDPAGQAWGWPLTENSRWWAGLLSEPEPGFASETGRRTFALSEIMVVRGRTGRGVAHALHDELLRGRHEQRATLLAEPENEQAYRAYIRWGWRKVSELRPAWPDAPLFDVLVLPLPLVQPV
jgi:hypothetical protein